MRLIKFLEDHLGQSVVRVLLQSALKNSYRIQNGDVHPQRIILFGPGFGMIVAIPPIIAGVLAVFGCDVLIRRRRRNISPSQSR